MGVGLGTGLEVVILVDMILAASKDFPNSCFDYPWYASCLACVADSDGL
jgi:hypothetical protein